MGGEAAKAGGFKGIVLIAKHHDGFCNWQTETSDHSVDVLPVEKREGRYYQGTNGSLPGRRCVFWYLCLHH